MIGKLDCPNINRKMYKAHSSLIHIPYFHQRIWEKQKDANLSAFFIVTIITLNTQAILLVH